MTKNHTSEVMPPVHPIADLFPMLADDELEELAADIAARGLLQPIVLDVKGRLLDGRNRFAACRMADVEPAFVTYDGPDPDGYALAVNIARRHLTKGQQAMVAARARLVSSRSLAATAADVGVSKGRVNQAAVVLDHAPDLADAVVAGAMGLDEAYTLARANKTRADTAEDEMTRLRADAPDLAALVADGSMERSEAIAALKERQRKQAENRRDARALLTRIVDLAAPPSMSDGFIDSWAEQLGEADDELTDLTKRAEQAAQILFDLAERLRQ